MKAPKYDFLLETGRVLNSLESSTIVLTGNVHDHFYVSKTDNYVPLVDFMKESMSLSTNVIVTYKITGKIKFQNERDLKSFAGAWEYWRYETEFEDDFMTLCQRTAGNVTYALELLRQMCLCSNAVDANGLPVFEKKLLIIIEAVETIVPSGPVSHLNDSERMRLQICLDWFKDPAFMETSDAVILIAESKGMINPVIARLPHVIEIGVPSPDTEQRFHFIEWFNKRQDRKQKLKPSRKKKNLSQLTTGLSILALRRLLKSTVHKGGMIQEEAVNREVKRFIERELGDIVEFKVPAHKLTDVVGCHVIKKYVQDKVIPRFTSTEKDCLPGATICGPIGSGKTFFWEAVAAESGMIVLVLRQLRDKWFGESDVRLERLRRILYTFVNVLVFIDEADTQFSNLGEGEIHATEKRIQAGLLTMMSDPQLRGKVKWLLLTARIDRLSHDMLRPGRPGSLIIPMLDPHGKDRESFACWAVTPVLEKKPDKQTMTEILDLTKGYFAAMFSELRSELLAEAKGKTLTLPAVKSIIQDIVHPAIGKTREYQSLCAKIYCNRRSLLPSKETREDWQSRLKELKSSMK